MRTWTLLAAVLVTSAMAVAGSASGQAPVPIPDTNDLGMGENDVREEPSHPDDDNNFPGDHDGSHWSPGSDTLILDAYATEALTGEDVSNVVNRALHGDNYGDHERTMYPGFTWIAAWWGWWSDHGGGGNLQEDSTMDGTALTQEEGNGAIDDADDCDDVAWDEFTWRGDHPCPDQIAHPTYPDDEMFGFMQPGTHWALNHFLVLQGPVDTLTGNSSHEPTEPDFVYNDAGQSWWMSNGARITYDSSLLISTSLVSAVNPQELATGDGITHYDPFTPAGDADDHAVDVDVYTTPHPAVEQAYRTAVWDPDTGPHPDRGENPDVVHENGPKGWLKDDGGATIDATERAANEAVDTVLEATDAQRGLVDDLVQDPFFHEPNHPDDDYNGWATHDADTSYGGLEGDYYEPGPGQSYTGYQDGERFWFDAQVTINSLPYWNPIGYWGPIGTIGYDHGTQFTPQVPSTSSPVEDAAREDSQSQGPGIVFMHAHVGTWYDGGPDGDADTWVGDAPADPYGNGTVQDPNTYEANPSLTVPSGASGPEWRGTCEADVSATLYPTSDTDDDGTNDWGAAGVYVMGSFADGNPYSNVWMDVIGPAADPVLDPLRNNPQTGDSTSYMFPEDEERLSRYRTTDPIEIKSWGCSDIARNVGFHPAMYNLVLPTGTLDFTFEAVSHATLTDDTRTSHHGENQGVPLEGQTVKDVDAYGRVLGPET